jgi:acetyl-CoA carboxylase carboxyltransferase component
VLIQVGDRLADAGVVGGQGGPTGRGIAQAVQDRDALGGAQDQVEGRHRVAAAGTAEQLPGVGVVALEHPPEAGRRCFAL